MMISLVAIFWTFMINSLQEVPHLFTTIHSSSQQHQQQPTTTNNNQHLSNVKYLRNDHGSESLNTELENFLTPQEIEHQLAVPRPPPPPPTRITRMALLNHPIKYYNNLLAIYLLMPWYQNHSGFLLLLLLTLMLPCFVTFVHC